jgi:putative hydrolase of the HAD superfamily
MSVAAVVFDLDYTLAVPERERQLLLDDATAAVGAPSFSRAEYLDAHRRNLTNETRTPIFADLLASRDHDGEASPDDLADSYRGEIERALVPVPGAETLVRDLRRDRPVGLLTDGPVVAQRGKLDTLGWGSLFDAVVVTGALAAGKPDERAFRAVLDELGTDPGSTVYVGDNAEADVHGAKEAGLSAVHVLGREHDACSRADAVVSRDRLGEGLPDLLATLS